MFCEKCGMKLPNDAKFCERCGSALLDFSTNSNIFRRIPNEKELHGMSLYGKNLKFRKKRTLIIFIIVVMVVGVMGLAIFAKLFFFSYTDEALVDIEDKNSSEVEFIQAGESDIFETYQFELGNTEKNEGLEYSDIEELSVEDSVSQSGVVNNEEASNEATLSSNNGIGDFIEETQQQSSVEFDSELDVEAEVKQIREWYYHPTSHETKHVLEKGTDGWNYAREYYFHDGELYFAFIFNGSEEHRLYFKNDIMIRYIDEGRQTFDYGNLETYSWWEKQALNESRQFIQ